ncbi:hypothetical protein QNO07_25990 [Streptomyces sp. 549]|uniref:hypothetical protein n=1 Tax=Streptomyces sp. 549 TaxID=3049076 RepID=UPI0024C3EAD3|nr:hypothetical protein [Streptomyces sp. 549]MDK1476811.1 hypothetical protein [Streptomyces sp. 549]
MSAARGVRIGLGAVGCVLMGVGVWLLLADSRPGTGVQVALWLAGAVTLHDFVLVPLVLAAGWALARLPGSPRRHRLWRAALVTAGVLTLVAAPVLLRPASANPSLLPLDYPRNWALLLAATAAVALLVPWAEQLGRRLRKGRP